jgi:hypothetical protein
VSVINDIEQLVYDGDTFLYGDERIRDYNAAFRLLSEAADRGSAEACRMIGEIYRYGLGCSVDLWEAVEYYFKANELDPFEVDVTELYEILIEYVQSYDYRRGRFMRCANEAVKRFQDSMNTILTRLVDDITECFDELNPKDGKPGNTPENLLDGGKIAVSGDWTYFTERSGCYLYKQRNDGSDKQLLAGNNDPDRVTMCYEDINIVGKYVYFSRKKIVHLNGLNKISSNPCRVNIDGTGFEVLNENNCDYMIAYSDWVYCSCVQNHPYDKDSRMFYRISPDGKIFEKLADFYVNPVGVKGGWMYLKNGEKLLKMRLDGTERHDVCIDELERVDTV